MLNQQPETVEDWLKLADNYRAACELLISNPDMGAIAWSQAGFALECTMKAAIHAQFRFNRWPAQSERRELYTHDLEKLAGILGMTVEPSAEIAPAWATVIQWRRTHMYNPSEFPPAVVRSLIDAVFSEEGMCQWMRRTYLPNY